MIDMRFLGGFCIDPVLLSFGMLAVSWPSRSHLGNNIALYAR